MRRLLALASAVMTGITFGTGALQADTITFNNGTPPLECRVLEEDPISVTVEINVTETIKDRKTIPRSVIKEITKVPPDRADFEMLRNKVVPTPDMMSVEDYSKRIKLLKPFLSLYPTSEYVTQVEKLIALLESEMGIVARGGVKLDGEWISPEERDRRRYNVDAVLLFRKMKRLANSHKEFEAIQVFDEIELAYPAAVVFPEAVLLARELIPELETNMQRMIVRHPSLVKEREDGLRALEASEQDHKRTREAIEAERREFEQILDREKLAKKKWLTYYAYDLSSLEETLDMVRKERALLAKYDVSSMRSTAGLTAKLMEFLHIKDLDKAETFLKQAEASGGNKTTLGNLRKEIERLRKAAKEGVDSKPPPKPDSGSKPKPEVKPPAVDPVEDMRRQLESPAAKRMRELEEEKQRNLEEEHRKKEAAAAATPDPNSVSVSSPNPETPVAKTPDGAGATSEPDKSATAPATPPGGGEGTETPETPEAPKGGKPTSNPGGEAKTPESPKAPTPAKPTAPTAKTGGGLPLWNIILFGLAGVLAVVTIIAKVAQKKEAKEPKGEE